MFSHGHKQEEVEQLFMKYDLDEDGRLDEEDVKKLHQELDHKKVSKMYGI